MKKITILFSIVLSALFINAQTTLEDYNYFKTDYTKKKSQKYFFVENINKSFDSQTIKERFVYNTTNDELICILIEDTRISGVNNAITNNFIIPSKASDKNIIQKCFNDFLLFLPDGDCVSEFERNRYSIIFSTLVEGAKGKY